MSKYGWHRRAQDCIAQGALTNSKRPEALMLGAYPTHVTRGEGCYLFDSRGTRYIDFICGLGTNILGYGNARIMRPVDERLRDGSSHSLPTTQEVRTAEKLKELFPFVDAWKFLKTGSEACAAAVRIARAHTGRDLVLSAGYHGWSDDFVSLTEPASGVPTCRGYRGEIIDDLTPEALDETVAAVIVEPVITDDSDERRAWLSDLRDRCTAVGAMLIFDEVITGFRWPGYSVARHWNITPDLICIGKAMANGFPLAAVGGKYAPMNGDYFVSSTYAGEVPSLVACEQTCIQLQTRKHLDFLWERGKLWRDEFNEIWPEGIRLEGYPTRGRFVGEPEILGKFFQETALAGILFGPSWFFNFHHTEAQSVMEPIRDILNRISRGEVPLRCPLPQSPFSQKVRHNEKSEADQTEAQRQNL